VLRRVLIGLAWAVTLVALLYAVSAWRARRAWTAYRTAYEAQAGPLQLRAYVPKEIPDAENFAALPLVRPWFDNPQTNWSRPFGEDHFSRVTPASGVSLFCERGGDQPHFCDLVAWRDALAATDKGPVTNCVLSGRFDARSRAEAAGEVLEALKDDEAVLDQLRQASSRPLARYPIDYDAEDPWSIRLPHLPKIKGICLRLELRACAELALNQTTNALADIKLALYVADTLRDEPIVISWLIRAVCIQAAVGPVWEGLAEHRWSDAQLQELQSCFGRYDFASGWEHCLRAERTAGVRTVDLIGRRDLPELSQVADMAALPVFIARFAPPSWRDREKLQYCRLFDLLLQGSWDLAARRFSPSQAVSNAVALRAATSGGFQTTLHHRLIARILLPPLGRTPFKAATAQTATDQALLACALERYRLANGQFPDDLQALTPKYLAVLPRDVVTGSAYEYRRTSDGRFELSSAGGDDTGAAVTSGEGSMKISQWFAVKKGDWAWSYGTNEEGSIKKDK
jgi:hypothetical protein